MIDLIVDLSYNIQNQWLGCVVMELAILVGIFIAITFGTRFIAKNDKEKDAVKIATMNKSDFVLQYPRGNIILLIVFTLISIALVLFVAFIPNDLANWWLFLIGVVPIICIYLSIDYLNWKMVVKNREVTLTRLFKQPKVFKIKDVVSAKDNHSTLLLYFDKKKKISVPGVLGIDLLKILLQEAGKFEDSQHSKIKQMRNEKMSKQDSTFELQIPKSQGIFYLACAVLAIVVFIFTFSTDDTLLLAILLLAPFVFIGLSLRPLRWRATVDMHTITIKDTFGKIKAYKIEEITRMDIHSNRKNYYLILTIDKNEIAKIHSSTKNTDLLLARLSSRNIPTYQNGKVIS